MYDVTVEGEVYRGQLDAVLNPDAATYNASSMLPASFTVEEGSTLMGLAEPGQEGRSRTGPETWPYPSVVWPSHALKLPPSPLCPGVGRCHRFIVVFVGCRWDRGGSRGWSMCLLLLLLRLLLISWQESGGR